MRRRDISPRDGGSTSAVVRPEPGLASGAALRLRLDAACACWKLSPRQGQVLALVARGDSNKTIAGKLRVSEVTVEAHVTTLLRKSRADSRTELAVRVWSGAFEGLD